MNSYQEAQAIVEPSCQKKPPNSNKPGDNGSKPSAYKTTNSTITTKISVDEKTDSPVEKEKEDLKGQLRDKFEEFGVSKELRVAINCKYRVISIIEKGAFAFVARGVCRRTNVDVALKVMVNQDKTEYDCVRMLREI